MGLYAVIKVLTICYIIVALITIGIKTESIPDPKFRCLNQSFFIHSRSRNEIRLHMPMLCLSRNQNQLQSFGAESDLIPVIWIRAQVW